MSAPISRRLSRATLIVLTLAALGTATIGHAAAAEPRPAPETGGIPAIPVDLEPGGPRPSGAIPSALNVFRADAFRYQDPNYAACTATSALVMLNLIALNQNGGAGFSWVPRWGNAAVDSILAWERTHDTLAGGSGSDPHGWRNALNYYGWGSAAMTDSAKRMYDDLEYTTYDGAVHAAIRAIARYRMPVGILGWAGGHAQVMTGYVVDGDNPAESDAFTVRYVFLSDLLYKDHIVNSKV